VEGKKSSVWRVLEKYPYLEKLLKEHDVTVYGEIIGFPHEHKTKRRYGLKPGEIDFYIFDMLCGTEYLDMTDVYNLSFAYSLKTVPLLGPACIYSYEFIKGIAEGKSLVFD